MFFRCTFIDINFFFTEFEGCPRLGLLNGYVFKEISGDESKTVRKETLQDLLDNSEFIEEGVVIHFKCYNGFTLMGHSYSKCLSSGEWQPNRPICKRKKFNGNRNISSSIEYYSPKKTTTQDFFKPGSKFFFYNSIKNV